MKHHRLPGKTAGTLLLLAGIALCWISCETAGQQCYVPVSVTVRNNFKVYWDSLYAIPDAIVNGDTTFVYEWRVDTRDTLFAAPQLQVIGEDSAFLITGAENATAIQALLNPARDSIRYAFGPNATIDTLAYTDTITFYYTANVHFISNACGYTYYYTLQQIKSTNHYIDSISLINNSVTQEAQRVHAWIMVKRN